MTTLSSVKKILSQYNTILNKQLRSVAMIKSRLWKIKQVQGTKLKIYKTLFLGQLNPGSGSTENT
jgi:hypothetical protein